mgnify:CR=1 FL=1
MTRNPLSQCVALALAAGSLLAVSAVAHAQDEDNAATLDRVEVTGSRIKRADIEGALPVTVIDRGDLELSGDISVADFLRNTTFNSFGSFRPQSGSSAQGFAGIALRGLGSGRSLVLVDGRRLPYSPTTGSGQDLNSVPLAAVERIEILSDGASAIYGSDAIGGVINIITRRDFNGVEVTLGMGNPKRTGGETEEGSLIFGTAGDRGNLVAGISYSNRGIIFARERDYSRGGQSTFSNNLRIAVAAPGTLYGFRDAGFVSNPNFGAALPGFDCDSNSFFSGGSGASSICFYDFTSQSADEAEIRQESLFARGNHQINDDWSTYLNTSVSRSFTFGRYAPVPSSPWPGGSPFIPVGSPNHPAVRFPDAGYDADTPYFLRHRFAALGPRDSQTDQNAYHFNAGVEGRIGSVFLDIGARRTEQKFYELGRNFVVGNIAQQLIADGSYDIYNPFQVPRSVLDSMIATINRESSTLFEELYVNASMDLFEMQGGMAGLALGVEYRQEAYEDIYDTLQSSGQIVGSSGNSAAGGRNVRAFYGELLLPVLENLELSLAARHDDYSDYGSDTSPKLSVRFQPLDTLTLRGSYGQGFRAPTLDVLTAQAAFSADTITDPATCRSLGLQANCFEQIGAYVLANPDIGSENSKQFSLGAAWDATDWLNLSLDYYSIEIEEGIFAITSGLIIQCLSGVTTCPPGVSELPIDVIPPVPSNGLGAARDPATGAISYVQRGFGNRDLETSGLDLNVRAQFDLGDWGALGSQLQLGYVGKYAFDGGRDLVDDPSVPEMRATLQTSWSYGDFNLGWIVSYIDGTLSQQGANIAVCAGDAECIDQVDYGYATRLPSWTTHDLQLTWNAPWNGKITLGVNNIADKDPVLDPLAPTGRPFDYNLYDGYGRVPYVRYTQNF